MGLSFCALFASALEKTPYPAGRQRAAFGRQSNKEVPLDAREDHFEMQRVQAEKLQHDEKQEEQP
jgi:hypothetical protein